MEYLFKPQIDLVGLVKKQAPVADIEAEPMLYDCDFDTAHELGGPLTKRILSELMHSSDNWFCDMYTHKDLHAHIDTKSVMLMPNFYPCIGGWHCDSVPRPDEKSQPDLSLMREDRFSYLCIIPSTPNLSNTEFITNEMMIDVDKDRVWNSVNKAVDKAKNKSIFKAKDGDVIRFNQSSIHRGMPSTGHGWRYFFRLTFTEKKPQNKIRHQVQVYTAPDTSW